MRIGIVSTWFERGAAYVSRQYQKLFKEGGHEVRIYARGGERYARGNPVWDTPDVTWGKRIRQPVTGIDEADFRQWIRTQSIELILFNEQVWLPPLIWAREEGVTTVGYVDYYTEATVGTFQLYDALICNTKRHMSVFAWHPRMLYLPWGTDTELFTPQSMACVKEDGPVFFHSGGMNPHRKGTDIVLVAFSRLKGAAHLVLHIQKSLAEAFPNQGASLQEYIHSHPNITLIEKDVTAPGLYHLGDVYVYPSRLDGIGLTQAEALSCGLPIIVPDNPPMNEFTDHDSGFAIPVTKLWSRADGYYWPQCEVDIEKMTAAMQFFIDKRRILPVMKRKAREYALECLNWLDRKEKLNTWLLTLKLPLHSFQGKKMPA